MTSPWSRASWSSSRSWWCWPTCSPTCCTRSSTPGSGMSAPLPELLAADGATGAPPVRPRALRIWLPAGFLVLLAAACFLWPLVYPVPKPTGGSILSSGLPPLSPGHLFGTDPVGNDIFSRILYGGQVSFEVGLGVTAIGLLIGGLLGMAAGYWGGAVDTVVMRVLDVLIAFPALVLALAIAEGLGPSEMHVIWALSFFSIPAFGRIARSATLALRGQTFMLAARLSGTSRRRIILRHVVPNITPQLLTFSLLGRVPGHSADRPVRRPPARAPRRGRGDGVPGPGPVAEPDHAGRRADRRGGPRAPRRQQGPGPSAGHRPAPPG